MKSRKLSVFATVLVLALTSCRTSPSQPSTPALARSMGSPTPDPCSTQNIRTTVALVNDHTRQFDDYWLLATSIIQPQLVFVIPPMQEIRRASEDQAVPACLVELKRLQLLYMNAALDSLLAFQASTDMDKLASAIIQARTFHEQYALELARVLGVTLTAPAPAPIVTATP